MTECEYKTWMGVDKVEQLKSSLFSAIRTPLRRRLGGRVGQPRLRAQEESICIVRRVLDREDLQSSVGADCG